MFVRRGILVQIVFALSALVCTAQDQPGTGQAPAQASPAGVPAPPSSTAPPSSLVKPALNTVQQALQNLVVDKWKKGGIRDQANENVNDLRNEIQTNLPPVLADADAAPLSIGKSIPLMKHLDAMYDVLLRVEEAARVIANGEQVGALQQALTELSHARLSLYDRLQHEATDQEQQITKLRATIQEQVTARKEEPKPAAPCTPPPPTHHRKHATSSGKTPPKAGATTGKPATPSKPSAPTKPSPQTKPQP